MQRHGSIDLVLVVGALYLIEGGVLLSVMVLYKNAGDSLRLLSPGRHGTALIVGTVAMVGATAYILYTYRRASEVHRRQLLLAFVMNAVTVVVSAAMGEGVVRTWSERTPLGTVFANVPLLPHSWADVLERNRELLERSPAPISYLVADELLGWVVGANRRSRDGLYSSSIEGIRSERVGVSYATRAASRRVALIGDSYTFGLEVPFKHSWGHVLENRLGPDVQVLNFGVDGYGVDQAYLRYIRDVRPWRPDIVVFGFIDHDLHRTMSVYTFLSFPGWALPFAKPRFVMNAGKLELINHPIPGPHTILSYASLAELPFLDYEPGYDAGEWEWSVIYHSHLVRFLLSRFPRFRAPSPEVSEHAVKSVSTEIFTSFAEIARKDGAVPLVVYFPSRSDFGGGNRHIKNAVVEELTRKGIEYRDLTDCLKRVDPGKRFLEGRSHYSEAANKTVALCLKGALVSLFER